MKSIKLTQGKFAIVDSWSFDWLNRWKWCANCRRGIWYAVRNIKNNKGWTIEYMHRAILGLKPGDGKHTDHINYNGLDNQECNIRIVTRQQNQFNCRNTKGYYWDKWVGKWRAQIGLNGKQIRLGYFDNKKDALKAYLYAKRKYHNINLEEKKTKTLPKRKMKHKWKLLSPGTGPLVATGNIHTPARFGIGWRLFCSKCKKCVNVPYDDLDTDNIITFANKQAKRTDCLAK